MAAERYSQEFVPSLQPEKVRRFSQPIGPGWQHDLFEAMIDVGFLILRLCRQLRTGQGKSHLDAVSSLPTDDEIANSQKRLITWSQKASPDQCFGNLTRFLDPESNHVFLRLAGRDFCSDIWSIIDPVKICVLTEDEEFRNFDAIHSKLLLSTLYQIDLVLLFSHQHICRLVSLTRDEGYPLPQEAFNCFKTFRGLVDAVDQMCEHIGTENAMYRSSSAAPELDGDRAHLGDTINAYYWHTFGSRAEFKYSGKERYITFTQRCICLAVTHASAILMLFYFRWPIWCSIVGSVILNSIAEYLYYGNFDHTVRALETEPNRRLKPDGQLILLHLLAGTYLYLSISEVGYILLWTAGLAAINHANHEFALRHHPGARIVSPIVNDILALHYALCGYHLRYGWLSLTLTAWFAGIVIAGLLIPVNEPFRIKVPGLGVLAGSSELPYLYFGIYVLSWIPGSDKAGLFLYHFSIPLLTEFAIKKAMDFIGWERSPIDLSGSLTRGFMVVLVEMFGYSTWQGLGLTMAVQSLAFLQNLAPRLGMT